jgi:hypothetical protein
MSIMAGLEERYYFDCPYCTSRVATRIDRAAGRSQSFFEDCVVCGRPVAIHVALSDDGVAAFVAEPEP